MVRLMTIVAAMGLFSTSIRGADVPPQQYLIHLTLNQKDSCHGNAGKVLAEPTLATVENRETFFHVGGEKTVAGEPVKFGTMVKVRVQSTNDRTLTIRGMIETAHISDVSDDSATRNSTSIYFKQTIELEETTQFKLPVGDCHQWLECRVEKVEAR